jgi:hypothetical protein
MMNKLIRTVSALALVSGAAFAGNGSDIQVTVDGTPIRFGLAKPIKTGGRVLVPLRGVFEQMGAFVQWNGATRTIDAQKDTTQVKLIIGNNYATVNGTEVKMDTPPQIVNGGTMVPLRFVSEALGANVSWKADQQLVAISTDGATMDENNKPSDPEGQTTSERIIDAYTVIPVTLSEELSSSDSRKGDKFVVSVDTKNEDDYAGIPAGSKLSGSVVQSTAHTGDKPGTLELAFDKLILPNGKSVRIEGSTYSLDGKELEKNEDGVMIAKNKKQDNRAVYAGYGAGAGILIGLLDNGRLDLGKALLGGLLGLGVGSVEKPKEKPTDVVLKKGMALGVRLNHSVALKL